MLLHQLHILEGCSRCRKAGRGLDEVRSALRHHLAHPDLLFLRKKTGLNDHLQNMISHGLLNLPDFIQDLVIKSVLNPADIDDHIHLGRSVFNGISCLEHLGGRRGIPVREPDHHADRNLPLHVFHRLFRVRRRNADAGGSVFDRIVTDRPDLLPGRIHLQQGVITACNNFLYFLIIHFASPFR